MNKLFFWYTLSTKGLPLAPDYETDYSIQSLKRLTPYFKAFIWNNFVPIHYDCLLCTFPNFIVYIFFYLSKKALLKIFEKAWCRVNSQSNR